MPIINYPEFEKYREQGFAGLFVGGCVKRGDGSSFRAQAHAHTAKGDTQGWICVRSRKRLYTPAGKPSMLMLHELAHILTGEGHTDKWRAKLRELGGQITKRYLKRTRRKP